MIKPNQLYEYDNRIVKVICVGDSHVIVENVSTERRSSIQIKTVNEDWKLVIEYTSTYIQKGR